MSEAQQSEHFKLKISDRPDKDKIHFNGKLHAQPACIVTVLVVKDGYRQCKIGTSNCHLPHYIVHLIENGTTDSNRADAIKDVCRACMLAGASDRDLEALLSDDRNGISQPPSQAAMGKNLITLDEIDDHGILPERYKKIDWTWPEWRQHTIKKARSYLVCMSCCRFHGHLV